MSNLYLITFVVLALASFQVLPVKTQPHVDASAAIQNNPEECFAIYMPQLATLADEFKRQYDNCVQTSEDDTKSVNQQVQEDLATIFKWQESTYNDFINCAFTSTSPLDLFKCYNAAASNGSTTSHNTETISKDRIQFLQMSYEKIAYTQNTCTGKCSQSYAEESKTLYTHWQDCLINGNSCVTTTTEESTSATA